MPGKDPESLPLGTRETIRRVSSYRKLWKVQFVPRRIDCPLLLVTPNLVFGPRPRTLSHMVKFSLVFSLRLNENEDKISGDEEGFSLP